MATSTEPSALRVVVPLLPNADMPAALRLAAGLAGSEGHVVLLAVVPILHGHDLPAATATARQARRQLRALARTLPDTVTHEEMVRAAETVAAGIGQVAGEAAGLLVMPLPSRPADTGGIATVFEQGPYRELVDAPVADTVFARPGDSTVLRSVLVTARGGPHAELALDVAQRVARSQGASVTVMHVDVPNASAADRQQEQHLFQALVARSGEAPRLRTSSVPAESAENAILAETDRHSLVVLGARVSEAGRGSTIGAVPAAALERSRAAILVVKPRQPVNPSIFHPRRPPTAELLDAWFIEHTLHCRDYANVDDLVAQKRRKGLTVGVALLAGASSDTLASHARVLKEELGSAVPLVDAAVLFTGPDDEMTAAATATGLPWHVVSEGGDRGRLMRASLQVLATDIVVWIDADIRNAHAKLVYGLAGPLIANDHTQYVKGFYGSPADGGDAELQHLVGEFAARPLLNLFFAELSGVIDPLACEHAIRRELGLRLPLFSGNAAQIGLLIDVSEAEGLEAISQVTLEERIARPLELRDATRRAFSAVQIISTRLGLASPGTLGERAGPSIKLIRQAEGRFEIDVVDAHETELLP